MITLSRDDAYYLTVQNYKYMHIVDAQILLIVCRKMRAINEHEQWVNLCICVYLHTYTIFLYSSTNVDWAANIDYILQVRSLSSCVTYDPISLHY